MAEQAVKPNKGDIVFYDVGERGDRTVRAKVLTRHWDGDISVEPMFFVGPAGTDLAGYIGGRLRMSGKHFRARAEGRSND